MPDSPQRWRVDVAGVPVSVYSEDAMRHLQQVNKKLAQTKMALHRIASGRYGHDGMVELAHQALRDIANGHTLTLAEINNVSA